MRMWMVDTKTMCRKHLLGEHVETHMILGTLKSGIRLDGYVRNNLLELKSLKKRHDEIAAEMVRRGYNHQSPLDWMDEEADSVNQTDDVKNSKVDKLLALGDLHSRCSECREKYST
ncbi:MAG: pyrimidine dimer DNA glycosylase/endonuclease V [Candidatus Thorarchaeota archaeon]